MCRARIRCVSLSKKKEIVLNAIGFDIMEFNDRYLRLPLYVFYGIEELATPKFLEIGAVLNRNFCSFVVSNAGGSPERNRFFH
ncbi:hypothetical protein ACMSE3_07700 [Bacteroides thetaiotaomicron]|uniref:hypothetical protein n=1 Tax=Bacteroides thetaiotaomicron TaxID=818 RepID=UPI0039C0C3C7|nr:hypothetical protein [Bacteroides thetaiotaomicron]